MAESTESLNVMSLIDHMRPVLFAYVHHAATTSADAADLFADVQMSAWLSRAEVLASPSPRNAVLHIARERCRGWVRCRRRETELRNDAVRSASTLPDDSEDASDRASMPYDAVLDSLSRLSDQQRAAVEYRFLWSWPYDIIAHALGCKEATVRVHVMRGLKALREAAASVASDTDS